MPNKKGNKMKQKRAEGNIKSWIVKLSNLFSAEQHEVINNSIYRSLKDIKIPKEPKYSKYKGRSIKFSDGKIYKNLEDTFIDIENDIYIYKFSGGYYINSPLNINEFFREYEYNGIIGNSIKRF